MHIYLRGHKVCIKRLQRNINICLLYMHPLLWGPTTWKTMHLISASYPNKPTKTEKNNYKRFYKSLGCVLPCKNCGKSYREYMKELDIDNFLDNKRSLMYWVYLIHNKVNKKLKKKTKIPFSQVYKKYTSLIKK